MKQIFTKLLRPLYISVLILALAVPMVLPAFAAEEGVYSASDNLIQMIISHEGFVSTPMWDYQQYSFGYGFNYDYAVSKIPEIKTRGYITEEEALCVLRLMIKEEFEPRMNSFLRSENIVVNQNQYDALMDLTYNIPEWMSYVNEDGTRCLLVQMLRDDPSTWTRDRTYKAFGSWVKAGGAVLEGLVRLRAQEAELFLTPVEQVSAPVQESSQGQQPIQEPEPAPEPGREDASDTTANDHLDSETPSGSAVFLDVSNAQWYYGYVMDAYARQLMQGKGEGLFGPEENLKRAELIQTFANFYGADLSGYSWEVSQFTDVARDAWYSPAIAWGMYYNLILPDKTCFGPEAEIDREELCIYLALFLSAYNIRPVREPLSFLDADQMSPAGQSAVDYCSARGIIDGTGDGFFTPSGQVSRAQIAKILVTLDSLVRGQAA